jgi:hypothetical protein
MILTIRENRDRAIPEGPDSRIHAMGVETTRVQDRAGFRRSGQGTPG